MRRRSNDRTVLSYEGPEGGYWGKLEDAGPRWKSIGEGERVVCCDISEKDLCICEALSALPTT